MNYGLIVLLVIPVFLNGADKSANSHIILRVCLGSIISSIRKDSADLKGDLNLFNLVVIFCNSNLGSFAFSISDLYAASIPPSSGKDPQRAEGHANLEI